MDFIKSIVNKKHIIQKRGVKVNKQKLSNWKFDWLVLFDNFPTTSIPTIKIDDKIENIEILQDGAGYFLSNFHDEKVDMESDIWCIYTYEDNVNILLKSQRVKMKKKQISTHLLEDEHYVENSDVATNFNSVTTRKRTREFDQFKTLSKKHGLETGDNVQETLVNEGASTSTVPFLKKKDVRFTRSMTSGSNSKSSITQMANGRMARNESFFSDFEDDEEDKEKERDYEIGEEEVSSQKDEETVSNPEVQNLQVEVSEEEDDDKLENEEEHVNGENSEDENEVDEPNIEGYPEVPEIDVLHEGIQGQETIIESMNETGQIEKKRKNGNKNTIRKPRQTAFDKQIVRNQRTSEIREKIRELFMHPYSLTYSDISSKIIKVDEQCDADEIQHLSNMIESGEKLTNGDPIIVRQASATEYVVLNGKKRALAYSQGVERIINVGIIRETDFQKFEWKKNFFEKNVSMPFNCKKIRSIIEFIGCLDVSTEEVLSWKKSTIDAIFGESTCLSTQILKVCFDVRLNRAVEDYIGEQHLPTFYIEKIVSAYRRNEDDVVELLQNLHTPPQLNILKEKLSNIEPDLEKTLQNRGVSSNLAKTFVDSNRDHPKLESFITKKWPNRLGRKSKNSTLLTHWKNFLDEPDIDQSLNRKSVTITDELSFDIGVMTQFDKRIDSYAREKNKLVLMFSVSPPSYSTFATIILPEFLWETSQTGLIHNSITVYFLCYSANNIVSEKEFISKYETIDFQIKDVMCWKELSKLSSKFGSIHFAEAVDKKICASLAESCPKSSTANEETGHFIANRLKCKCN